VKQNGWRQFRAKFQEPVNSGSLSEACNRQDRRELWDKNPGAFRDGIAFSYFERVLSAQISAWFKLIGESDILIGAGTLSRLAWASVAHAKHNLPGDVLRVNTLNIYVLCFTSKASTKNDRFSECGSKPCNAAQIL